MSYQTDSIEFAAVLGADGVPADVITQVLRDATALHRLAEHGCNYGLDATQAKRVDNLEARVSGRLAAYGVITEFDGDPRGAVVKLRLPSGRGNSFGDPSLYCVPTR